LKHLKYCFADSKILKPHHFTNDLYIIFPRIKATELLFRMGKDGCDAETFHRRCDNKGATLTLISANGGFVFGGYNPTSWVSQYSYSDCEDAFLFSICNN
jgi:hypothetical protein